MVGVAVTVADVVLLSVVEGDQVYVLPPLTLMVVKSPLHII